MILLVVHVLLLIIAGFLVYKRQPHALRIYYWPALIVRCAAGICLGLLYLNYYDGEDTLTYFLDARSLNEFAVRNPQAFLDFLWSGETAPTGVTLLGTQPRAMFFSKFTSIISLFGGGNYWIISLYFSFISFLSAWYLTSILHERFRLSLAPAIAFLFFPSAVFWTSGLIKESFAMAAMFFITAVFIKLYTNARPRLWEWIALPLACWILWSLKYYFIAVFLPVASTLLVMKFLAMRYLKIRNRTAYAIVWLIVFLVPLYIASIVHPNFYPERFLQVIVENHDAFVTLSEKGDIIEFSELSSSPVDVLRNIPMAVYSGIFRPLPWETSNLIQLVASFENLLIAFLSIWALLNLIKRRHHLSEMITPLVAGTVLFVILLAAFLALSTPNFGTLSRYRVGFLPYYILLLVLAIPLSKKFDRTA